MPDLRHFAAIVASGLACSAMPAAAEDSVSLGDEGAQIVLADGALEIELGGKLQFDAHVFELGDDSVTSADFRRARPDLRVRIADVVSVRAEWEFAGTRGWRNLYAQMEPFDGLTIRGGNFIPPFSMEDLQSSATVPFAERSLASAIAPGYGLGGQVSYSGRRFTVRAGYFGKALDSEEGRAPATGHGVVARATLLAIDTEDTRLQVGVGGERRDLGPADSIRFSATAGTTFAPSLLRSRRFTDISSLTTLNGEFAMSHRGLAVQGQYMTQELRLTGRPSAKASGGYIQAAWMVTGQEYRYSRSSGTITGPRLRNAKMPAVELAARYSRIAITESGLARASAHAADLSAGLHLTPFAKVLVNGTIGHRSDPVDGSANFTSGVLRLQLAF